MATTNDCSWIIVRVCFSNYKYGYMDRDLVLSLIHTLDRRSVSRDASMVSINRRFCISAESICVRKVINNNDKQWLTSREMLLKSTKWDDLQKKGTKPTTSGSLNVKSAHLEEFLLTEQFTKKNFCVDTICVVKTFWNFISITTQPSRLYR